MSDQEAPKPPSSIEGPLELAMARILQQNNVRGVLISDKEGLCVGASGSLAPINSARLTNIFDSAMKMAPDHEIVSDGQVFLVPEQPILIIESLNGQLITNNIDGFCTTVAYSSKWAFNEPSASTSLGRIIPLSHVSASSACINPDLPNKSNKQHHPTPIIRTDAIRSILLSILQNII